MSLDRRRELIDRAHPALSIVCQYELMSITRSGLYHQPVGETPAKLALMPQLQGCVFLIDYHTIAHDVMFPLPTYWINLPLGYEGSTHNPIYSTG
jgi:hypothetical protein